MPATEYFNPYEEIKKPEHDDVGNYDPDLIDVPKMARKRSANIYTTRVVRMFNKRLQDFVRFSGLTGVRTVSDELCSESSFFSADSD